MEFPADHNSDRAIGSMSRLPAAAEALPVSTNDNNLSMGTQTGKKHGMTLANNDMHV